MTTEDKIKEIIESQPLADSNYQEMIKFGAQQMADWKDLQTKDILIMLQGWFDLLALLASTSANLPKINSIATENVKYIEILKNKLK